RLYRHTNEAADRLEQGESGAQHGSTEDTDTAAVIEHRDLVFMRNKSAAANLEAAKSRRIVKPLTFNAHRIHLDPQYCREVEGHRNLVLHGPLSLVLMLSVLKSQLGEGETVQRLDYRNLAPLYAYESLRICISQDSKERQKYDVWIEGAGGGYAVKGTAVTV
ncbi:hypothetical protein DH86_00004373, partial [Scytalidium sp. 3C]